MEKLLMLGTSLMSREIVQYAKSQGVYTIVTDYLPPDKSTAKLISDEYWMINTSELDVLEKKCRDEHVTAVMCGVSEFNLEMTMALCSRLGLPSYCTPEAWHYSRDKADFKKVCRDMGVPVAQDYFLSRELKDEELNKVEFPVVVKPIDLSGNRGITYCYNKQELIKAIEYAHSLSNSSKIVVEHMLHGKEWYAYYAIANGEIRQICVNAMEAEPGQLKNLYSITTSITDNVERIMKEINPQIENALKCIGCREGIAWVQFMLDEDDHFYVIEMGYRLPGDLPDVSYPDLCGFNSVKWLTDYARGIKHFVSELPSAQKHMYKKCCCGYSLWTHKEGVIKQFIGFEEICKMDGVDFYTLHQVGDKFAKHRPIGVVTVIANDCEEFCEKIDAINKTISIIDDSDEDVVIRYDNFDYLKNVYEEAMKDED